MSGRTSKTENRRGQSDLMTIGRRNGKGGACIGGEKRAQRGRPYDIECGGMERRSLYLIKSVKNVLQTLYNFSVLM